MAWKKLQWSCNLPKYHKKITYIYYTFYKVCTDQRIILSVRILLIFLLSLIGTLLQDSFWVVNFVKTK